MKLLKKIKGVLLFILLTSSVYAVEKWPEKIVTGEIELLRITEKSSQISLKYIIEEFGSNINEVEDLLRKEQVIVWTINQNNTIKGYVQLHPYATVEKLFKEEVTDYKIAQMLFEDGARWELSYSIGKYFRGKGIAARALEAWVKGNKSSHWLPSVFSVVQVLNPASAHLLEKYAGFKKMGSYYFSFTEYQVFLCRPYNNIKNS